MKYSIYLIFTTLYLIMGSRFPQVFAQSSTAGWQKLQPRLKKTAKKQEYSYQKCKQNALAAFKKAQNKKEQARYLAQLKNCQARFPAVSYRKSCYQKALALLRQKKKSQAQKQITTCKKEFYKALYTANDDIALKIAFNQPFFLGQPLAGLKPFTSLEQDLGMNCEPLMDVKNGFDKPEYMLFPEQIDKLRFLSPSTKNQLLQQLKKRPLTKPILFHQGRFALYKTTHDRGDVYAATSFCYQAHNLNPKYIQHKIYYLLNPTSRQELLTYFAVSFFNPQARNPMNLQQLSHAIQARIKEFYQLHQTPQANQLRIFIDRQKNRWIGLHQPQKIGGLPHNICHSQLAQEKLMAYITAHPKNPLLADKMVLFMPERACFLWQYGNLARLK